MDSEEKALNAGDIQDMLDQAGGTEAVGGGIDPGKAAEIAVEQGTEPSVEDRANQLLDEVDAGLEDAISGRSRQGANRRSGVADAEPFQFTDLSSDAAAETGKAFSIGILDDVQLDVQVELGRAELLIDEVLSMREGVVIPLDKLAGDPIDIVVNGRLLARGEVLVLNDKFCVRISEIVATE
ncbi:MAG: flagellar motor switch protein FliN [Planctomycetota bacterium]|nr:flagellar motor switch protein FliN [Planctomycetota bacterium]MDA1163471.1 flagellar motor switch protein FliN [Planctomycetota bacterium]